jgi:hypothetical protein
MYDTHSKNHVDLYCLALTLPRVAPTARPSSIDCVTVHFLANRRNTPIHVQERTFDFTAIHHGRFELQ